MTTSTITYPLTTASLFMSGASKAHGTDQASTRGYVALARRYER
jgi:hypothetical protein